jgi:hypothetical protein
MPMSDYLKNKLTDHVFRAATFAKPTAVYVGLFTASPTAAGGGTEVTAVASAYVRQNLPQSDTNWLATQGGTSGNSSGTTGQTKNAVVITYPVPTADWGTVGAPIAHYGIYDALAGNLLFYGAFTASKVVLNGDQAPVIAVNGMTVTWT